MRRHGNALNGPLCRREDMDMKTSNVFRPISYTGLLLWSCISYITFHRYWCICFYFMYKLSCIIHLLDSVATCKTSLANRWTVFYCVKRHCIHSRRFESSGFRKVVSVYSVENIWGRKQWLSKRREYIQRGAFRQHKTCSCLLVMCCKVSYAHTVVYWRYLIMCSK